MTDHDETLPLDPDLTRTSTGAPPPDSPGPSRLPERIGRYRPLRILGQGGMGVVYEAEQDEPRRRVALKVIRSEHVTENLRRRFAHESVYLGRLQHPGIAQVYESGTAGTDEGPLPFIAMELVDGVPLDRWVRVQEPDLRARVELMIQLCDAVQHAHQRGLIHRDLKPGNVLVDAAGRVRVLDFGLARPHDADFEASLVTTHGELVGTLAYMSPEQLGADPDDIDTRTDIYSLGMIFYELMSEVRPFDLRGRALSDVIQVMREEEPPALSQHDAKLAGDLTLIAATAMAKDRVQRYASANGLAADLRRYLADEPIAARPPSTIYQLKKFARRHRPLVIGIGGVAAALVLGVVVSSWQAIRATRAEQLAETRREQTESVNGFLQDMLASVQPEEAMGREVTVKEILDRATGDLDGGALDGQPGVEMALRRTLGLTYHSLGRYDFAYENLGRARALADSLLPTGAPEIQQLAVNQAYTEMQRGNIDSTEALLRTQLDRMPPDGELYVDALAALANVAYKRGLWQEADSLQARAEQVATAASDSDSLYLAGVLLDRAFLAQQRNEFDRASHLAGRVEAIYLAHYGDHHPRLIRVLNRKGDIAYSAGRLQEAVDILERALAIADEIFPAVHPTRADVLGRLALARLTRQELDQAKTEYEEALAIRRELIGPVHSDIALTLDGLGRVEARLGEFDAAQGYFDEALAMRRELFGEGHPAVVAALQNLGHLERARGNAAQAESLFLEADDVLSRLPERNYGLEAGNDFHIAMAIQDQQDHARAEVWFRSALEVSREAYGDHHPYVARGYSNLATNLFRQGRKAEAAGAQRTAMEIQRAVGGEDESLLLAIGNVAYILDDAGQYAEADSLHSRYIALAAELYGDEHPGSADARGRYCENLVRRGLFDQAEAQVDTMMAWRAAHLAPDDYRLRTGTVYAAMVALGRGQVARADSILTAVEVYLPGAEGLEPRRRATVEKLVAQVRAEVEGKAAGG